MICKGTSAGNWNSIQEVNVYGMEDEIEDIKRDLQSKYERISSKVIQFGYEMSKSSCLRLLDSVSPAHRAGVRPCKVECGRTKL